eukprot:6174964-Pleurochrysis_carterae.AAC.1
MEPEGGHRFGDALRRLVEDAERRVGGHVVRHAHRRAHVRVAQLRPTHTRLARGCTHGGGGLAQEGVAPCAVRQKALLAWGLNARNVSTTADNFGASSFTRTGGFCFWRAERNC